MLSKTTHTFSPGPPPLDCDVYSTADYAASSPGLLFFHAGALIGGARDQVPPWLVQVCMQRGWPLISASYRFLPQATGADLLEDARAAYAFAQTVGRAPDAGPRRMIVAGGSAGFFMASLIAQHLTPKPAALLSITGIPTFHPPFFTSSLILTPSPIPLSQVEPHIRPGPILTGVSPSNHRRSFVTSMLLPSGARNPSHEPPAPSDAAPLRSGLYYYFLQTNSFPVLLDPVDLGYEWAGTKQGEDRLAAWPRTVLLQGDADADVDKAVSISTAEKLGPDKAALFLAPGMDHRFEDEYFLEDDKPGMPALKAAIAALDEIMATDVKGVSSVKTT